jgi:hypothetical protein
VAAVSKLQYAALPQLRMHVFFSHVLHLLSARTHIFRIRAVWFLLAGSQLLSKLDTFSVPGVLLPCFLEQHVAFLGAYRSIWEHNFAASCHRQRYVRWLAAV